VRTAKTKAQRPKDRPQAAEVVRAVREAMRDARQLAEDSRIKPEDLQRRVGV